MVQGSPVIFRKTESSLTLLDALRTGIIAEPRQDPDEVDEVVEPVQSSPAATVVKTPDAAPPVVVETPTAAPQTVVETPAVAAPTVVRTQAAAPPTITVQRAPSVAPIVVRIPAAASPQTVIENNAVDEPDGNNVVEPDPVEPIDEVDAGPLLSVVPVRRPFRRRPRRPVRVGKPIRGRGTRNQQNGQGTGLAGTSVPRQSQGGANRQGGRKVIAAVAKVRARRKNARVTAARLNTPRRKGTAVRARKTNRLGTVAKKTARVVKKKKAVPRVAAAGRRRTITRTKTPVVSVTAG
ncbi:hypothetical protein BV898_13745 [Hypsibius exemplaris]|uniref:Uncharacterized protein n=1 Tax=Hypsibius exemplaris TaxID=2072580 RepID=A0A1W0W9V0_HYPEX|nr:hypothetical protein BV898_13745 [Hypsibius exemplaris]